jgi:hypothetical protein
MHMNLLFGTGLPFGPPTHDFYKDVLRMPPYRRVDIGFSYEIVKETASPLPPPSEGKNNTPSLKDNRRLRAKLIGWGSIWFSLEVNNLLGVNNTVSYFWVRDVNGRQYAVPNYLSARLLNARIMVRF